MLPARKCVMDRRRAGVMYPATSAWKHLERRAEGNAARGPGRAHLPGRAQPARVRIETGGDDRVAVLIRDEEKGARGIDIEVAGLLALGRCRAHVAEQPRGGVAGEDDDTVMPPIGGIDK